MTIVRPCLPLNRVIALSADIYLVLVEARTSYRLKLSLWLSKMVDIALISVSLLRFVVLVRR